MVSSMAGDGARPRGLGGGEALFGDIRRFDSIDSTNRYLLDEARRGAPEGLVAVADHQGAGRGRLGRTWEAPAGSSLLASVLFRPELDASQLHLLTVISGLAAADACFELSGVMPGLKWPNDLMVGHRKLGGILAEADLAPSAVSAVVVGIGINLSWPGELPADLSSTAVTLEEASGVVVKRDPLLDSILSLVELRYRRLGDPWGRAAQATEYKARCTTLGQAVRIEMADETFTGTGADIDNEGHLLVDVGMCLRKVTAGDVVHLRPIA